MKSSFPPAAFTGVSLGSRHWSMCDLGPSGVIQDERLSLSGQAPPSLLVPRYAGEPIRFDAWYPTHPRGSGRSRPAEANIGSTTGAGRFPLAAAWSGRRISGAEWVWGLRSESRVQVDPVEAVAAACRSVVARYGSPKTAVVIPNDFQQSEQQRTLDEISHVHPDTQLLWLPVAAALAWLEGFDISEWDGLASVTLGDLVIVHCDWGHLQVSRIELRQIDRKSAVPVVPARRRVVGTPRANSWVRAATWLVSSQARVGP